VDLFHFSYHLVRSITLISLRHFRYLRSVRFAVAILSVALLPSNTP
jgi:hypothetical protein